MYHIAEDKRAMASAELTEKALYELLGSRDLNEISVTDICAASGVSRATFYRLFDTTTDVLRRGVDRTMDELVAIQQERVAKGLQQDARENLHYMLTMEHYQAVEAAVRCHRTDLIHTALRLHIQPMLALFGSNMPAMNKRQQAYMANMLVGMLTSALTTWIEGGRKETEAQLFAQLRLFSDMLHSLMHK